MTISFSGLASGLDTSSWVESLVALKRAKVETLEEEKETTLLSKETLDNIKSFFNSFRSMLEKITDAKLGVPSMDLFAQNLATSSNTSAITASATTEAEEATYNVLVDKLASNTTASSNYSYMTTIIQTTTASSDSLLINLGVSAGKIGVKVNGVEHGISIEENDTIASFIEKLKNIGVEASFNEQTGIFSVNLGANDINDDIDNDGINNTNIVEALHLEGVNEGYESNTLTTSTTDTIYSAATESTTLIELGLILESDTSKNIIKFEANDTSYTMSVSETTTLKDLLDFLNDNNIEAELDATGVLTLSDVVIDENIGIGKSFTGALGLNVDIYGKSQVSNELQHLNTVTVASTATSSTLLKDLGDGISISDGDTVIVKNSNNEYTTITIGTNTTIGNLLTKMTEAGLFAVINEDGSVEIAGGTITGGTFDAISALQLASEPYTAMVTGKALSEIVTVHEIVTLETKFVDDLGVKEGYLEVTDTNGDKFYEKIYSGQTIGDFMADLANLGIYSSLDTDTGVLTITGGAFKTLSDTDVLALIANNTIHETEDRYKHGTNILECLYGADTIETGQISIASTYSRTRALTREVVNTISATTDTTLGNLSLSANGTAVFDVRGELRTISILKTTTIQGLMDKLAEVGIASSWDEDNSRLTIENATLTGGTTNLSDVLNLTTTISGKYVTSNNLYTVETITIDATRDTVLKDYGILNSMSESDRTVKLYDSNGNLLASTVVGEGTTIGNLIDFINNNGGSANIDNGVFVVHDGYIENATLEASMGLERSNKSSYVLGSIMTITTNAAVTGDTTLGNIISTLGTSNKVASGYTLYFNSISLNVSSTTTIDDLIGLIYDNGGTAVLDNTGRLSINGGTLTGTVAEALGVTSVTNTSSVSATGKTLFTTKEEYADRDTVLADLGIANNSSYILRDNLGNAYKTVTVSNTITIGTFMDQLKNEGIDAIISNGVISLTSAENKYITGTLATALGISTQTTTITVNTSQSSTLAVTHTGTVIADLNTTLGEIGAVTVEAGQTITIFDEEQRQIATITLKSDNTIGDMFAELEKYGITGSINDGIINLYSPGGRYATGDIMTNLGISFINGVNNTFTIADTITSSVKITFTDTVMATASTKINLLTTLDAGNTSVINIYDNTNTLIGTVTLNSESTVDSMLTALAGFGISGTVKDGVITLVSADGIYATGAILTRLGIGTQSYLITTTAGKTSTSTAAISYTGVVLATEDELISSYITLPNNKTIVIYNDNNAPLSTITVSNSTTFGNLFAQLSAFDIDGDIHNGVIKLTSPSGNYIQGDIVTALGISTVSQTVTTTVGKNVTSTAAISYTVANDATATTTLAQIGINKSNTVVVHKSDGTTVNLSIANSTTIDAWFDLMDGYGIQGVISDGIITLTSADGAYVTDASGSSLLSTLGITTQSYTTTHTIGKNVTSTAAITYTTVNDASYTNTLAQIGINQSNTIVVHKSDGTTVNLTIANTTTLDAWFDLMDGYGIQGVISDGIITLTSADGAYVTDASGSSLLSSLGISTQSYTTTVTVGKNVSSTAAITYTTVNDASYTNTLAQIGINQSNTIVVHKSDGTTVNLTIANTTTIDAWFDLMDGYGIQGVISDGVITLTSADGAYVTDASGSSLLSTLGISVQSYNTTHTIGKNVSSTAAITYTTVNDASYTNTLAQLGINQTNTIVVHKSDGTTVNLTIANTTTIDAWFDLMDGYGIQGVISDGIITLTSADGAYVTDASGSSLLSTLGIGTQSYTTTVTVGKNATSTAAISYTITENAVLESTLAQVGVSSDGSIVIHHTDGSTNTIGVQNSLTIDQFFTLLNGQGIQGVISDGVITLTSVDGNWVSDASGSNIMSSLGIQESAYTQTATVSKSLTSSIAITYIATVGMNVTSSSPVIKVNFNTGYTTTYFSKTITTISKSTAQANGYIWVTTRQELTSAMSTATSSTTIVLGNNLDMSDSDWVAIDFKGTLDGNGYCIKNININGKGFINALYNGIVKNLGFENATNYNTYDTGIIVGHTRGATIDNCYVYKSTINNTSTTGSSGAITAAILNDGNNTITNCNVVNTTVINDRHAGGVIGSFFYNVTNLVTHTLANNKVYNCNIEGGYTAGGLIGSLTNSHELSCGTITVSNTTISVKNQMPGGISYIGGIFGYYYNPANNGTTLRNLKVYKTTIKSSDTDGSRIGGIAGEFSSYYWNLYDSYIEANVTKTASAGYIGQAFGYTNASHYTMMNGNNNTVYTSSTSGYNNNIVGSGGAGQITIVTTSTAATAPSPSSSSKVGTTIGTTTIGLDTTLGTTFYVTLVSNGTQYTKTFGATFTYGQVFDVLDDYGITGSITDSKITLSGSSIGYVLGVSNPTGSNGGYSWNIQTGKNKSYTTTITHATEDTTILGGTRYVIDGSINDDGTITGSVVGIYSGEDLIKLKGKTVGADKTLVLMNDITISDGAWAGITLNGTFDGCGYTITEHLTVQDDGHDGLFTTCYGTIRNVNITGSFGTTSERDYNFGALVGELFDGIVSGCSVVDMELFGSKQNYGYFGGLVGYSGTGGTITNCLAENVSANKYYYMGGICGRYYNSTISNCYVGVIGGRTGGGTSNHIVGRKEGNGETIKCITTTVDATATAISYGWDESVWDLSGSTPELRKTAKDIVIKNGSATTTITVDTSTTYGELVQLLNDNGLSASFDNSTKKISIAGGTSAYISSMDPTLANILRLPTGQSYYYEATTINQTITVGTTATSSTAILYTVTSVATKATTIGELNSGYKIDGSITAEGVFGNVIGISTAQDLVYLQNASNRGSITGKTFVLLNDIDMTGVTDWVGIGREYDFQSDFDGQGYSIKNLELKPTDYSHNNYGLFGSVRNGTIKNLVLDHFFANNTIALNHLGVNFLAYSLTSSTVDNVRVINSSTSNLDTLGIACKANNSTISNCSTDFTATHDLSIANLYGGIIGNSSNGQTVTIEGCSSNMKASGNLAYVGGIVALATYGGTYNIKDCLFNGSINNTRTSDNTVVGGLFAGYQESNTNTTINVEHCIVTANMSTAYGKLNYIGGGSNSYGHYDVNLNGFIFAGTATNNGGSNGITAYISYGSSPGADTPSMHTNNLINYTRVSSGNIGYVMGSYGFNSWRWNNSSSPSLKTYGSDALIIKDKYNNINYVATIASGTTLEDFISLLGRHKIEATLTDGVLTLNSDSGYYIDGGLLDKLGLTKTMTSTIGLSVTSTATLTRTVVKTENISTYFTNPITRMDKATAEANGYIWVTTRQELTSAMQSCSSSNVALPTVASSATIVLGNDIDLSDSPWKNTGYFRGNIDGNGYCIKNMVVNEADTSSAGWMWGFIGCLQLGTVKNLGFENCSVYGRNGSGVIACGNAGGTISNCYVYNSSVDCDGGGILCDSMGVWLQYMTPSAQVTESIIEDCKVISSSLYSSGNGAGLVCGAGSGQANVDTIYEDRNTISNCIVYDCDVVAGWSTGGITCGTGFGAAIPDSSVTISSCIVAKTNLVNHDKYNADGSYVGGIITWAQRATITACQSFATIISESTSVYKRFGGIAAYTWVYNPIITDCYSQCVITNKVSCTSPSFGQISAYNSTGSISNCSYYNGYGIGAGAITTGATAVSTLKAEPTVAAKVENHTSIMSTTLGTTYEGVTLGQLGLGSGSYSFDVKYQNKPQTISVKAATTLDELFTTLAGYGISGRVENSKIILDGSDDGYITYISPTLRTIMKFSGAGNGYTYQLSGGNANADQATYDTNMSLFGDTTFANLGISSNQYVTVVSDGTMYILTVQSSDTLDDMLTSLAGLGIYSHVEDGKLKLQGDSQAYIQGMTSDLKTALSMNVTQYVTKGTLNYNTNSDKKTVNKTVTINPDSTFAQLGLAANGTIGLNYNGVNYTVTIAASDTLDKILTELAGYGISNTIVDGKLTLVGTKDGYITSMSDNVKTALKISAVGANNSYTTTTETHYYNTNSNKKTFTTTVTVNPASTFAQLGLAANGTIGLNYNGVNYTVTIATSDTLDKILTQLAGYGISNTIVDGKLTLVGTKDGYITSMSDNVKTALKISAVGANNSYTTTTETHYYNTNSNKKTFTTTVTVNPDSTFAQLGLAANGTIGLNYNGVNYTVTIAASDTLDKILTQLAGYGISNTIVDGKLTLVGTKDGYITSMSDNVKTALKISTVGNNNSYTTTTETHYYNTNSNKKTFTTTVTVNPTSTFAQLGLAANGTIGLNYNGVNYTVTIAASDTLDKILTELAGYGISNTIVDGKLTLVGTKDGYITSMSDNVKTALKISAVGNNNSYTTTTETHYYNTNSNKKTFTTTVTVNPTSTFAQLGLAANGTIGLNYNGVNYTVTIATSDTLDKILTELAGYGISNTIVDGKLTLVGTKDGYITSMSDNVKIALKISAVGNNNSYTTSTQTIKANTTSSAQSRNDVNNLHTYTKLSELGVNANQTVTVKSAGVQYIFTLTPDSTIDDLISSLGGYGISGTVKDGKLTLVGTTDGYITGMSDGLKTALKLNTGSGNTYTVTTRTTYANDASNTLKHTETTTLNTNTTFAKLGMTGNGYITVTMNGTNYVVTVTPDKTVDDIISTIAGYGISASVTDGKITFAAANGCYIKDMSDNVKTALKLTAGQGNSWHTSTGQTWINTDSTQQSYVTNTIKLTGDTVLSTINGWNNGNGSLIVHKTDGTFVTISVNASNTLDQFFDQIAQYGLVGTIDEDGKVTIMGIGNVYLQSVSGGSNILSALKLSNLIKNVQTVTVNRTSNVLKHTVTVAASGTTTLESLEDISGTSLTFDASGKVKLTLNTYSDAGNNFLTLSFSKTQSLYDVIDELAKHGINASVDAMGKFSVTSSTLNDFDIGGTLGTFLMGAYSKEYGTDTTYNVTTNLVQRTIVNMTDSTPLSSFGITNGNILITQQGVNYTVNIDTTLIKTVGDFRNLLAQYGFSSEIDSAGRLCVTGIGESYLSTISGGSNIIDKFGLTDWTLGEITQTSDYLTDTDVIVKDISMQTKISELTNSSGVNLGITNGSIYVYQDGTRSSIDININDTLETLAAKLSQYGISMGISQEGRVYFDGNNNSYLTIDGIASANASNILSKIGVEGNWSTRYDSTSDNLTYETTTNNVVTGSTKLSDLQDSSGNNLGITTGAFYVYQNGVRNTETITEDMTVNDLMATMASYGLIADISENGQIAVSGYNETYIATSATSGANSNIASVLFEEWDFTNIYTSNHIEVPKPEIRAIERDTKLENIISTDVPSFTEGYITVIKDGVQTDIYIGKDDTVGTIIDQLALYGFDCVINDSGQLIIKNYGDSKLQAYTGTGSKSNALELLGINLNNWINTNSYEGNTLNVITTSTANVAATRETLLSKLGVTTGEYYIYQNGVKYTALISSDETLGSFIDTLKSFGLEASIVEGNDSSILTITGKGNSYIAKSSSTSAASNVTDIFNNLTETKEYSGLEQTSTIKTIYTEATEATLVSELSTEWGENISGTLSVTVNGIESNIQINANETIGSILEKFKSLGLEATIFNGQIVVQSGYNTFSINTDKSTSSLANPSAKTGLIYNQDLGGYSASTMTVNATTTDIEEKTLSASSFAGMNTKMGLLNISDGTLTVYRNGQKASIDITSEETFGDLNEKLKNAFTAKDLALKFEDGFLSIYSTDSQVSVEVGSTTDTTNFASITGIANLGEGFVKSSRELYCVNGDSVLTTAGLFRAGDVKEGTFIIGDDVFTINASTKLSEIISQINSSEKANATAYWDSIEGKLVIKSRSTGSAFINIEAGTSNFTDIMGYTNSEWKADGTRLVTKMNISTQDVGNNAVVKINGTTYTSTSNTISSDVSRIKGLTINLKGLTEGSAVTLTVEKDKETLANAVSGVVDAYNELMKNVDEAIAQDGQLHDQSTLKMIRNQLRNIMMSSDLGTTVFKNMSAIGISTSSASASNISTTNSSIVELSFDKDKFIKAFESDQKAVKALLIGSDTNKGIFTNLEIVVESTLQSVSGYFDTTEKTYKNQISKLEKKIEKENKAIEKYKARLEAKFASMDMLIANIQQQYSSFLIT